MLQKSVPRIKECKLFAVFEDAESRKQEEEEEEEATKVVKERPEF